MALDSCHDPGQQRTWRPTRTPVPSAFSDPRSNCGAGAMLHPLRAPRPPTKPQRKSGRATTAAPPRPLTPSAQHQTRSARGFDPGRLRHSRSHSPTGKFATKVLVLRIRRVERAPSESVGPIPGQACLRYVRDVSTEGQAKALKQGLLSRGSSGACPR